MTLTLEEHIARAALLGKVYDNRDNTYCDPNPHIKWAYGWPTTGNMLDADTLEPVDSNDERGYDPKKPWHGAPDDED